VVGALAAFIAYKRWQPARSQRAILVATPRAA
jgi:hypothetical protein